MNSILNEKIRHALIQSAFIKITDYISDICEFAVKDYRRQSKKFLNNERKISSILVREYMQEQRIHYGMSRYIFDLEIQENYIGDGKYAGRVDIRALLKTGFLAEDVYYIVECKRIDGSGDLNQKYVNEGIARFVSEKYTSRYGKNIMLGYVVRDIDVVANTKQIENIQNLIPDPCMHGCFQFLKKKGITDYYSCVYYNQSFKLELWHLFSNFSDVVS